MTDSLVRLQYGSGWHAPVSWLNFDSSPTLRFERLPLVGRLITKNDERFPSNIRYGNIVTGLPVPDQSADLVYCSHVLEHLTYEDCVTAIRNTWRVLKPGGTWRLVLPDLRPIAARFVADTSPTAATDFMRASGLGRERSRLGVRQRFIYAFGNSQHQWMWDHDSLAELLRREGFTDVRRAVVGDSAISDFDDVEQPERWKEAVGLQCHRANDSEQHAASA